MTKTNNQQLLDVISDVLGKELIFPSDIDSISDEIYAKINNIQHGLNAVMSSKSYPASPGLFKNLNDVTDISDRLAAVPFLHDKKVVYLSCRMTGTNINLLGSLLPIDQQGWIKKFASIRTNQAMMVYKTEEPVIYTQDLNVYVSELTMEKYKLLILGCSQNNIPLYKIIRQFIIGLPLKYDVTFIFEGSRRGWVYNMYRPIICDTAVIANDPYDDEKDGKILNALSSVKVIVNITDPDKKQEVVSGFEGARYHVISSKEFIEETLKDLRPAFVSLYDRFLEAVAPVEIWYNTQLSSLKSISSALNRDIIVSSSSDKAMTAELRRMNDKLKQKYIQYETEENKINELIQSIGSDFKKIDELLCHRATSEYLVTRSSIDPVLRVIFNCADNGFKKYNKDLISHLRSLRYERIDLVEKYIDGKAVSNHDVSAWTDEWEKAKYFLNSVSLSSDISSLGDDYKALIIYALKSIQKAGVTCQTADELFLKGFVSGNEREEESCYKTAVYKGSVNAADILWDKCGKLIDTKRQYFLTRYLANSLYKNACIALTEQDIKDIREKFRNVQKTYHIFRLTDRNLFYYKMLAAKGDGAALSQIVDLIYNDCYSKAYHIKQEDTERTRIAHILIRLCDELINRGSSLKRYKEIKGILIYCLDRKDSAAFDCLDNTCSTTAGHFCLGQIYQYGNGRTSQNLEKAYKHLKRSSSDSDFSERAKREMQRIEQWEEEDEKKQNDYQSYDEHEDYSSHTTSYTDYSDDGCVTGDSLITMGDGSLKRADEIKDVDLIMAWELEKGCIIPAPLMGFHKGEYDEEHNVLRVCFDDGTIVSVISEHLFFDCDLNRFIGITEGTDNSLYLGHKFAKATENGFSRVTLKSITAGEKTRSFYAPIPEKHLTYMVGGMISVNARMLPLCNRFDFDGEKICYDPVLRENDLKKYGMLPYECVEGIVSKDYFDRNAAYEYGVSIGKGLITQQELIDMIRFYRDYMFDRQD